MIIKEKMNLRVGNFSYFFKYQNLKGEIKSLFGYEYLTI